MALWTLGMSPTLTQPRTAWSGRSIGRSWLSGCCTFRVRRSRGAPAPVVRSQRLQAPPTPKASATFRPPAGRSAKGGPGYDLSGDGLITGPVTRSSSPSDRSDAIVHPLICFCGPSSNSRSKVSPISADKQSAQASHPLSAGENSSRTGSRQPDERRPTTLQSCLIRSRPRASDRL